MSRSFPPLIAVGFLWAAAALAALADQPPQPPPYRDTATYPPYSLTWNTDTDLQRVRSVYPHLFLTRRALVATETGLSLTDDYGHTWADLPEAAVEKIGPVNAIAFHPVQPNTFYVASQSKGVWLTTDNGKTFTQVGSKAKGMASDTVVSFIIYPGDGNHQTLLAAHGSAAAGLSRSRDGGQTWDVVDTEYHFNRIFGGEAGMAHYFLFGSSLKEPDIQSVYTSNSVGEFITEVVRDVVPTDLAFAPVSYRQHSFTYLTTSDSGLYSIDNNSDFGMAFNITKLPYTGVDGWASVGVTWGPTPEGLNLFLYDPTKVGLVVAGYQFTNPSTDNQDISQGVAVSDGLPVSPLTKEGAVLRPNANGTVCYAVANGALSIGRAPEEVPVVDFNPAAFEVKENSNDDWQDVNRAFEKFTDGRGSITDAAKKLCIDMPDPASVYHNHQIVVTARVPVKPAPPSSVTIDLTRYGGLSDTPLYDDGQHGDGAAGDGVYGTTFLFLPGVHRMPNDDKEWRAVDPGHIALGVVATYADGTHQGAVGVVNFLHLLLDQSIWHDGVGSVVTQLEGGVTAEPFLNPLAPKQPAYAPRLHKGDVAVRVKIPKGAWKVHFMMPYNHHDISGYPALSLYARLDDGAAPKELNLQFVDEPEFSAPTTTDPVSILNGMTLNAGYQRITIPMSQLLGSSSLKTDHLSEIILSGNTDAPATLVLDGLAVIATYPPLPPPPEPIDQ